MTDKALVVLQRIRRDIAKLRADVAARDAAVAGRDGAVNRRTAAKMMGFSLSKLEARIRSGDIRTCVDVRLIPLSEVRRVTAPKLPRRKPRRHDRLPDARDEARTVRDALRGAP